MTKRKILFIGGSLNQTTIADSVAAHLKDQYDCYFTPYYGDGMIDRLAKAGWLDFTVLGGNARLATEDYLKRRNLKVDYAGKQHDYDLVVTTSDLLIQKNIRGKKVILIQEGMTDPENLMYYLVKYLRLPRYLASTSVTGFSNAFDYFCVASEGYRELFIKKGVLADKIVVTGIPNFDNMARFLNNDFPHKGYVLVATSDARETLKYDNRKKFIRQSLKIANGRPLFFKLHPNENRERATREISELAPQAKVFYSGNTNHMIANCDVLVTQYSSVVYVGMALGKEVHSYFDMDALKQQLPLQNGGRSGERIAAVCRTVLEGSPMISTEKAFKKQKPNESPLYGAI